MAEYRSVEGELGAVDTLTSLTTFAGESSVGPIKVPADSQKLVEIWAASGFTIDTSGDQGAVVLRLSGKGMAQGDQDFVISAAGISTATIGSATGSLGGPASVYPVDIAVTPNENITVQVAAVGDDVLIGTVGITLVFA